MELLTINKTLPRRHFPSLQEPLLLIKELKEIVRDLKDKNPKLYGYKLMDVGFTSVCNYQASHMRLYFVKRSQ